MKTFTRLLLSLMILGVFFGGNVYAQKKSKKSKTEESTVVDPTPVAQSAPPADDEFERQKAIFRKALGYSDLDVATYALYNMLSLQPEAKEYQDTLAFVYFQRGAFPQALLLGREILENEPDKNEMLELVAISEQSLGLVKESLASYEKLYGRTKSIYHLYEIAALQYGMKRFGECEQTLGRVLMDEKAATEKISLNIDQQQRQEVPISAAAYNMKGVLYNELGQNDKAKEAYTKALEIEPRFVLAQKNLELLSKGE